MQSDVKGYGTIRPVEQDAKWGDKALRSKKKGGDGYSDYLLINSFTDEGLNKITDYNNYREEWDSEKKAIHRRNAYVSEKICQLQTVCETP